MELGLALIFIAVAVYGIAQMSKIGDRGARETRSFRRRPDAYSVMLNALATSGASVVDLRSLTEGMRSNLPWAAWKWVGSPVLAAAMLWLWTPLPPALVVAIGTGFFLIVTLPDDFKVAFHGYMISDEGHSARDYAIYVATAGIKAIHVGFALWMLFRSAESIVALEALPAVIFFIGGLVSSATAHVVPALIIRAGILGQRHAKDMMQDQDSVLFLRSFQDDDLRIWTETGLGGLAGRVLPTARLRLEVVLAQAMARSPVVAIGRPGDVLRPIGAIRTHWGDEEWQSAVRRSATRVRSVVIVAGASGGLAWEMERVREWGLLSKTLIIIPPGDQITTSARVEQLTQALGVDLSSEPVDWSAVVGVSLDRHGQVVYHVTTGRDWAAYMVVVNQAVAASLPESGAQWDDDPVNKVSAVTAGSPAIVEARRTSLPLHLVEPVPHLRMIRILNAFGSLPENVEDRREMMPRAVKRIRKALSALGDDPRLSGTQAYYSNFAILLMLETIPEGTIGPNDVALARRCHAELVGLLTLARQAHMRVTLNADLTATPDEIELDVLENLALVHELLRETEQRVDALATAVAVSTRIPAVLREVNARRGYAAGLVAQGRSDLAHEQLRESLALAQGLSQWHITAGIYEEIAAIEAAGGDYSAAAASQKLAVRHLAGVGADEDFDDAALLAVEYLWHIPDPVAATESMDELLRQSEPEDPTGLGLTVAAQAVVRLYAASVAVPRREAELLAALLSKVGLDAPKDEENLAFDQDALAVLTTSHRMSGPSELRLLEASLDADLELRDSVRGWLSDRGCLEPSFWQRPEPAGEQLTTGLSRPLQIAELMRHRAGYLEISPDHILAACLLTIDLKHRLTSRVLKPETAVLRSVARDLAGIPHEHSS